MSLAAAVLVGLTGSATLKAEGLESPKEFYEPGYVNQPGERSSTSEVLGSKASLSSIESTSSASSEESSSEAASVEAYAEGEGDKPLGVSLLVSTSDPDSAKKRVGELVKFAARAGLNLKDLYLVGDIHHLAGTDFFSSLAVLKGSLTTRFMTAVPKEFGVIKRSPALLVETRTGFVVVEAYPNLNTLFAADGRFIEPSAAIEQKVLR